MPNMSYCRFQNTYRDLLDCLGAMNDDLSEQESNYRYNLVKVCQEIIQEYEMMEMSRNEDDE